MLATLESISRSSNESGDDRGEFDIDRSVLAFYTLKIENHMANLRTSFSTLFDPLNLIVHNMNVIL